MHTKDSQAGKREELIDWNGHPEHLLEVGKQVTCPPILESSQFI